MATADVFLTTLTMLPAEGCALLDEHERTRARAYRFAADRTRFVLAAVLLRVAVARALDVPRSDVEVDRTCDECGAPHGRPTVPGAGLHVSASHSGDAVAVAVTAAGPVGVDVEAVPGRPGADYRKLLPTVCTPEEQRSVSEAKDFYAYWTRKEAVLKATGHGLRLPMTDVVVTPPGLVPELLSFSGDAPPPCRMHDINAGPGYLGAAAVLTSRPVEFSVRDAAAMLACV